VLYGVWLIAYRTGWQDGFRGDGYTTLKTDPMKYFVRNAELEAYKARALKDQDGDAAMKVAIYFYRFERDIEAGIYWLEIASSWGNKDASYWLSQVKKPIDIMGTTIDEDSKSQKQSAP